MSYDSLCQMVRSNIVTEASPFESVMYEIDMYHELTKASIEYTEKAQKAQDKISLLMVAKHEARANGAPRPIMQSIRDRLTDAFVSRRIYRAMAYAYTERVEAIDRLYLNDPKANIKKFLTSPNPKVRECGIRLIGKYGLDTGPSDGV